MRLPTFLVASLLAVAASSFAAERGTADEAVAMTKKAVAYLKANGKEKSLAEFNKQEPGPFKDRDLYVMVVDKTGTALAHGGNAKIAGKNLIELKDSDGKLIVKEEYERLAQKSGKKAAS